MHEALDICGPSLIVHHEKAKRTRAACRPSRASKHTVHMPFALSDAFRLLILHIEPSHGMSIYPFSIQLNLDMKAVHANTVLIDRAL